MQHDVRPHQKVEMRKAKFKSFSNNADGNRHYKIITDIAHITFPCLSELMLFGNLIESIEILSKLQMPVLRQLAVCNYAVKKVGITSPASKRSGRYCVHALKD